MAKTPSDNAKSNNANFRVGLIQMRSGRAPQQNIDAAARLIDEAKAAGADYVQTPEMTNIMEIKRESLFATLVPEETDASLAAFRETARRHRLWVHVGSLAIKVSPDKAANRSFLIDPQGEIVARYDKIHMFDVDLADGETYRESRSYRAGETAVAADLPWGRLGLTVCYDLRFPALYRALAEAGASFLAIPAAFTRQTGEAHWHVLMRARAIENTSYVIAAAQGGKHENGRETFGHSLVVNPSSSIPGAALLPKAAPSPAS
jgi:deaminated glutathione amidase